MVRRLSNTARGNPRWRLALQHAGTEKVTEHVTRSDSMVAHEISPSLVGKDVWLVESSGKVVDVVVVNHVP